MLARAPSFKEARCDQVAALIWSMPNVQSTPGLLLNHQTLSAFIRSVADLLRGDYKQPDYGKVILPPYFGQWSLWRVIGKEPLPPRIGGEDLRPVLGNDD